jgi:protein ImuB
MFAAIYIPNFALQALLRHEPQLLDAPVALLQENSPKSPVRQVTGKAGACGVVCGMTSTQAKARCESILFKTRSPIAEETAQEILIECAYQAAAFIESTEPGVCTMDLRGLPVVKMEPPLPAFENWAGALKRRIEAFHLSGSIGIAAAPGLALQAAKCAPPPGSFIFVEHPREFWKSLPVDSLSPALLPEIREILSKWGLHTVGAFLALGKAAIAARLGPAGVELYERAHADRERPLNHTTPKQIYEESFEFEQQVETLEPLLFILRRFLDQLARRIEMPGLAAEEVFLSLRLESGDSADRALKIPSPTRDVDVLFRILHNYLENLRTSSAVVGLSLRLKTCRAESEQFQLFETAIRDPNRFYETAGRLSAWLGADRVGTPVIQNSHRSDDVKVVPLSRSAAAEKSGAGSREDSDAPRLTIALSAVAAAKPRGLVLRRYRPPRPAVVRLEDGRPIFIQSNGMRSTITKSAGPWRKSGQWWEALWTREEWDIETKEGLYRIFREGQAWLLEGAYD